MTDKTPSKKINGLAPAAAAKSGLSGVTHLNETRRPNASHDPDDMTRDGEGPDSGEADLKAVVSMATAQLGQDIHAVAPSSIETGNRALMERLQRIAEQADERALRQFGSLQHQVEDTQRQILSAREDFEAVRRSVVEQMQVFSDQGESAQQQLRTTEQRLNQTEQQIHIAEGRLQAAEDERKSVEQRLRTAEHKNLDGERNWQRAEDGLQTMHNQLESVEQQLQTTLHQLQEFPQQLADVDSRIKTQLTDAEVLIMRLGQDIKSCEQRLQGNAAEDAEIKRVFADQAKRRENVEISIGELARDVDQFKAQLPELTAADARIKSFHGMLRSNRRMQRAAVAASILSLLLVVYIGLDKPGWPAIADYISLWVPR